MIRLSIALIVTGTVMLTTTLSHTKAKEKDAQEPVEPKSIALVSNTMIPSITSPDPTPPQIVLGESESDKQAREQREREAEAERQRQEAEAKRLAEEQRQREINEYNQRQQAIQQEQVQRTAVRNQSDARVTIREPYPVSNYCSCVDYVRAVTGIDVGVIGYARNWPINSQEPRVGGVVITAESSAGHVAKIIGIEGDDLILDEANYSRCRRTSGRRLNRHNRVVRGFYNP